MRLLYRRQRDVLAAELTRRAGAHVTVDLPEQGMHLVAHLKHDLSDVALERAAHEDGIVARAISRLYRRAPAPSGLMLGFAGYPQQLILPGAARLAGVIRESAAGS